MVQYVLSMWAEGMHALKEGMRERTHTRSNTQSISSISKKMSLNCVLMQQGASEGLHGLLTYKDNRVVISCLFILFITLSGSFVKSITLAERKHGLCVYVVNWRISLSFTVGNVSDSTSCSPSVKCKQETDAVSWLPSFSLDLHLCQPWRCL